MSQLRFLLQQDVLLETFIAVPFRILSYFFEEETLGCLCSSALFSSFFFVSEQVIFGRKSATVSAETRNLAVTLSVIKLFRWIWFR